VIAGARGDHAALGLFRRECQEPVERATFLKRTGHLQVFKLEKNPVAGHSADGLGVGERREVNLLLDPFAGLFDVDERDHAARLE
jgi:hypothetical protein